VTGRLVEIAFALGAGATTASATENADAAVAAIAALAVSVGMTGRLADFGIGPDDFGQIAADALDDEVLANAPLQPSAADVVAMLGAASDRAGSGCG
jgi:alcohol dehydrogenase